MTLYLRLLLTALVLFGMGEGFTLVGWCANFKNDLAFLVGLIVLVTTVYLGFKALFTCIWREQWNKVIDFVRDI